MPFLLENIISTVVWLIIIGLTMTAGVIMVTIQRRLTRRRYFQLLDRARYRAQEAVEPLYQGQVSLESALVTFRNFRSAVERRALEEAVLWRTKVPEHAALTREVAEKMGWVSEWVDLVRSRVPKPTGAAARVLSELGDTYKTKGRANPLQWAKSNFLARANAAEKLTRNPTAQGLMALIAGTQDPHVDVQEVCIRSLGRLRDPATIPVLIDSLVEVLEGRSRQSVRNVKTSLVQFALEDVDTFVPALEHGNRRVRFFATDVVREISDRHAATELLSKNDFSPTVYRLFTEKLSHDEFGDVRARAAVVVGHFHDTTTNEILQRLLVDEEWYVRLHACRAAAGKFFLPIAPAVAQRLTDANWLVREAAVRTLHEMGDFGDEHIFRTFLASEDRYAAEQICEEIQRSGMLAELLANIQTPDQRHQAMLVSRRMVAINKVTMLLAYLLSPVGSDLKLMLIRELGNCPLPECLATLDRCRQEDTDDRVRAAATAALQSAMTQAAAAAR